MSDRGNKTKILAGGGNPKRENQLRLDKMVAGGEIQTFAKQFILISTFPDAHSVVRATLQMKNR